MKENLFEKTLNVLIFILGILVIYWIILKLTNHSPTIEQLMIAGITSIAVVLFRHEYKLGKLDEFRVHTIKELEFIRTKVEKIDKIEMELAHLKSDIAFIKSRV